MKKGVFIAYTLFLLAVTGLSYFFVDPNLPYLHWFYIYFQIQGHVLKAAILFFVLCVFFGFYLVFLWMQNKETLVSRDIFFLIGITIVLLFFSYPAVFSYDIFNYIATAKVAYFYHENPYIMMPIQFTGDPLLAFMHSPNKTALYAPFWILLTSLPFYLGAGNFLLTLFFFKLLIVGFYVLSLFLLLRLSKTMFPVLFFGLNPLVVIETLLGAHNDIVMISLTLFSIYFYLYKKPIIAIICYALSIGIKYATIFLFPLIIFKKMTSQKDKETFIFRGGLVLMLSIFLLSFLREEIYPWYAIWFLPFVALAGKRREIVLAVIFSFCLELRYFPYLLLLTHFGITPILKTLITFVPVISVASYFQLKKIWSGK